MTRDPMTRAYYPRTSSAPVVTCRLFNRTAVLSAAAKYAWHVLAGLHRIAGAVRKSNAGRRLRVPAAAGPVGGSARNRG